jgi:glucose-1-phosphate cytidylyltransferase
VKVVLFCGGMGTRLREHSETPPKPLVNVGHWAIICPWMPWARHPANAAE